MIPFNWPLENALSLLVGLILSLYAISRLFIAATIRISTAFKNIKSNKKSISIHINSTDQKFKDLNIKVNQISEKIDKIYTILINK